MYLCKLADAYNQLTGESARSKSSGLAIAKARCQFVGNVRNATEMQLDEMTDHLQIILGENAPQQSGDGRHSNCGRPRLPKNVGKTRSQYKQSNARYFRERYASDKLFALSHSARRMVNDAIRKAGAIKSCSTKVIVGCSAKELMMHIERQFHDGMNWDNRSQWHIDHIVPLSSAKTVDELKSLLHFTNLRPLWAKDNLKKSSRITHLI